ncbi:uncharacterized protein LOC129602908 isoform X2 [Betta splendens]|uniref:Uncharacterized protein LOC129602908 isoform X2 n=1 Tax=Betta splendens TaxID=158456 RepID=A0A6P7LV93_BETSP|nr:uncharacterized protein LOC129602908 isoform X2 [Betta splendens]
MKIFVLCLFLHFVSHHASADDIYEGDTFLLPCEFHTFDVDPTPSVLWSRYDLRPSTVHRHQKEGDAFEDQNQLYSGRTSMMTDALETGDLSLTLTQLKVSDSGTYTCSITSVRGEHRVTDVQLQVKEWFPSWVTALLVVISVVLIVVVPVVIHFYQYIISVYHVDVESGVQSVQLPCKTMRYLTRFNKVEWYQYTNIVHTYEVDSEPTGHHHIQTEMKVTPMRWGNFSLTLKNPTEDNSGSWTCSVYRDGEMLEKKVHLQVKVPKVKVAPGQESVLLLFRTTVPSAVVVWSRKNGDKSDKVHVFHNGSDQPEDQPEDQFWLYRSRTEMTQNDFSLTLKHPTDFDSETFMCTVYGEDGNILRKKEVRLNVEVCKVKFAEGEESVLLPFRTTENLPDDVVVEWRREDLNHPVHIYLDGSEQLDQQDPGYEGRTEMKADLLTSGDFSLTLKEPKVQDEGTYVCEVFNTNIRRRKTVKLQVKGGRGLHRRTRRDSADPTPLLNLV